MEITKVAIADLGELSLWYQQLLPHHSSLDKMKEALEKINRDQNPIVLVAKLDGKLVGTLLAAKCQMLFGPCQSFMVAEDVVVDANYRRQGVATKLIQHIEQYARAQRCSYIMLITDRYRTESQLLYQTLGYETEQYCAFKKQLAQPSESNVSLEERTARGRRQKFERVLRKVKDAAPAPDDELDANS